MIYRYYIHVFLYKNLIYEIILEFGAKNSCFELCYSNVLVNIFLNSKLCLNYSKQHIKLIISTLIDVGI